MNANVFGRATWAVVFALIGCGGSDDSSNEKPGSAATPLVIQVPGSTLISGFAAGSMRSRIDLKSFRITKYPTTQTEYTRCVKSGRCPKIGHTCNLGDDGLLAGFSTDQPLSPALCVGVAQASKYCSALGGKLPTLSQWLLAARGPEPKLYAWGDEAPNCSRSARAQTVMPVGPSDEEALVRTVACGVVDDGGELLVAKHKSAASPFGMQDVLLAPAELLATDPEAQFTGCKPGFKACLVTGNHPSAIEAVTPIQPGAAANASEELSAGLPPYGFRCVFEEK